MMEQSRSIMEHSGAILLTWEKCPSGQDLKNQAGKVDANEVAAVA